MRIDFDDFSIQIGRGVAGSFSGYFEYDEFAEIITGIWLDVWMPKTYSAGGYQKAIDPLLPTHPIYDRFRNELEIAYADQIREALDDGETRRGDPNAEHRLDKRELI